MTTTTQVSPSTTTQRSKPLLSIQGHELWILCGQAVLGLCIVVGFDGVSSVAVTPKVFALPLILGAAGVVLLGPKGVMGRLIVSAPVVAVIAWWLMSYSWTYNVFGWTRETTAEIPLIIGVLVAMSLIPIRSIEQAFVYSCHFVIAWTVFWVLSHPGSATINPAGVPGWRGDFIHKNAMAPFMLLAILLILAFERRPRPRLASCGTAILLVAMSQSTTTAVAALVLVPIGLILRRMTKSTNRVSWTRLGFVAGLVVLIGYLVQTYTTSALALVGKDPTLTDRTKIWSRVLRAASERPLTGYGVGGTWINQGAEPTLSIVRGLGFPVFHSHNGFLEILIQLGAIGLVFYALLALSVVVDGYNLVASSDKWGAVALLFVGLIVLLSLSEVATFGSWLALLCGIRVVLIRKRNAERLGLPPT